VNTDKTTLFISDFYTNLAKKEAVAKALKQSKLKMINEGLHPYFWAGFVLNGSGS